MSDNEPKFYLVGGAVRDLILGIESRDNDYVVVGATHEWMIENGYEQVGSSFPVYLKDGCEYALARQERKVAPGYHGFETKHDSSVTLEDDLLRRDLTINSMAMDDDGHIIDPHGGRQDLEDGILRHTSDAFADDPLRVMRLARFAARYGFDVHPDTIALAKKLVDAGELDHLPKERVWAELRKGLSESNPAKMLRVLHEVGAVDRNLMPYFQFSYVFIDWLDTVFDLLKKTGVDLSVETKFLMCFEGLSLSTDLETAVQTLSVPKHWYTMSKHFERFEDVLVSDVLINAESALDLLNETKYNAIATSPEHESAIRALQIDDGFTKYKTEFRENLRRLDEAYHAVKRLDMKAIADAGSKTTVKDRIEAEKRRAIEDAFGQL